MRATAVLVLAAAIGSAVQAAPLPHTTNNDNSTTNNTTNNTDASSHINNTQNTSNSHNYHADSTNGGNNTYSGMNFTGMHICRRSYLEARDELHQAHRETVQQYLTKRGRGGHPYHPRPGGRGGGWHPHGGGGIHTTTTTTTNTNKSNRVDQSRSEFSRVRIIFVLARR